MSTKSIKILLNADDQASGKVAKAAAIDIGLEIGHAVGEFAYAHTETAIGYSNVSSYGGDIMECRPRISTESVGRFATDCVLRAAQLHCWSRGFYHRQLPGADGPHHGRHSRFTRRMHNARHHACGDS